MLPTMDFKNIEIAVLLSLLVSLSISDVLCIVCYANKPFPFLLLQENCPRLTAARK